MKKFIQLMIGLCMLVALMSFSGCSSKDDMLTPHGYSLGVPGKRHAKFNNTRNLCKDRIMYIITNDGTIPVTDSKSGKLVRCGIDKYGRVIALGTIEK